MPLPTRGKSTSFYAMNDWRSTFGGLNDHEADWEQVTVYLVPMDEDGVGEHRPDGADVLRVGWLAFSSHDETGDDLRRRSDDPDITWVDGTHPVVYASAGSHSGAYLPGEYFVRVEPPGLLLRFWTEISLSAFLALLGGALLFGYGSLVRVTVTAVVIVMGVEAILRRRVRYFVVAVIVVAAIVVAAITGIVFLLVTNLRAAAGVLLSSLPS